MTEREKRALLAQADEIASTVWQLTEIERSHAMREIDHLLSQITGVSIYV